MNHHGSFLSPSKYAMMFAPIWRKALNNSRIITSINGKYKTGLTKIIANIIHNVWSRIGAGPPGLMFSLLFIKEPSKSPAWAPTLSRKAIIMHKLGVVFSKIGITSNNEYTNSPVNVPHAIPASNPLHVLFFPKIGLLSRNFFPKSIGVPPPKITGVPFAT